MDDTNSDPILLRIPSLLRPEDVAKILRISRSYVYSLLQTGELPAVRIGKACRVRPKDLEEFIEQNIHRQSTILT